MYQFTYTGLNRPILHMKIIYSTWGVWSCIMSATAFALVSQFWSYSGYGIYMEHEKSGYSYRCIYDSNSVQVSEHLCLVFWIGSGFKLWMWSKNSINVIHQTTYSTTINLQKSYIFNNLVPIHHQTSVCDILYLLLLCMYLFLLCILGIFGTKMSFRVN